MIVVLDISMLFVNMEQVFVRVKLECELGELVFDLGVIYFGKVFELIVEIRRVYLKKRNEKIVLVKV